MISEYRATSNESRATSHGFSLMEVLLAVGTLAVGMLFIAGVFPVGIHFTTIATERTTAAIVADEAFAKIMLIARDPCCPLYASNFQNSTTPPYSNLFELFADPIRTTRVPPVIAVPVTEFSYPSTVMEQSRKQYWWSAVCKWTGSNDALVTVFVSRKTGTKTGYYGHDTSRPVAVTVPVLFSGGTLQISDASKKNYINDGFTIVDDMTGEIYRVLERYGPNLNLLRLDKNWGGGNSGFVWVVPPPSTGGRYPCIAVYQKIMSF